MNHLAQKLEYLRWLKLIGVEYYFSEKKDSDITLINEFLIRLENAKSRNHNNIERQSEESNQSKIIENHIVSMKKNVHKDEAAEVSKARKLAEAATSVEELEKVVKSFDGCKLKDFAANTVFADGNNKAQIMLIGEAPGAKEDELGIPFCGESGILLDTMLLAIKLSRKENIYITNTIFWRPPANRKPTKQEMDVCKPFLEKHISLIAPKLIICVGSTAVTGLFGDKATINFARHNLNFYQNRYLPAPIPAMAIFHPAYLLRQPGKKKDSWFDLIKIQQFIKENF